MSLATVMLIIMLSKVNPRPEERFYLNVYLINIQETIENPSSWLSFLI